jgi:hypothetical protein
VHPNKFKKFIPGILFPSPLNLHTSKKLPCLPPPPLPRRLYRIACAHRPPHHHRPPCHHHPPPGPERPWLPTAVDILETGYYIRFEPRQGEGHASAHCHVLCGSGPCLPVEAGSGAIMCPTALDPTSCSGGLRCSHVSHGSRPRLPDREGSSAATCHMTPDPASRLERAPVLPRVIQLRTPPPCSEGFGATICPIVSDPASLLRRALVLLRVPRPSESHEP